MVWCIVTWVSYSKPSIRRSYNITKQSAIAIAESQAMKGLCPITARLVERNAAVTDVVVTSGGAGAFNSLVRFLGGL